MDDTIEICSGCGKMPRAIDHASGAFVCSRCGNRSTMHVNTDNYEKVAAELDSKFHHHTQKARVEAAASAPVEMKPAKKPAKVSRPASKKGKPAAKTAPKKKAKKR